MHTTLNLPDKYLLRSSPMGSSAMMRQLLYVSNDTMRSCRMRSLLSPPPSQSKNCAGRGSDSPNQQRYLCLKVHFDCWCQMCKTMIPWDKKPTHPNSVRHKNLMISFGTLKKVA